MEFAQWAEEMTGDIKPILEPCPSAVQLRTLFLKYIRPDGSGRRDDLPTRALTRGKRQPGAPEPEDIIEACISAGYLQNNRSRDRIRRVPGDRYNNMVDYVKDWEISKGTRLMLDNLCTIEACDHVPIRSIA